MHVVGSSFAFVCFIFKLSAFFSHHVMNHDMFSCKEVGSERELIKKFRNYQCVLKLFEVKIPRIRHLD